jgi:O-antigen ligase
MTGFSLFKNLTEDLFLKILISFLIISLMGASAYFGYQHAVTYVLIPLLLVYVLYKNHFELYFIINKYIIIYIFIIIMSLILTIQSIYLSYSLANIVTLFGILFSLIIIVEALQFNSDQFFHIIFLSFVVGFYITVIMLLKNKEAVVNISGQHLDRAQYVLNANKYSYFSFIANFAVFYLIELTQKKIYIILSVITTATGLYITFLTASRSGLLFTIVIAVIYWLFIYKGSERIPKIIKVIPVIVIIILGSRIFYKTFNGSYLQQRVEQTSEQDSRVAIARDAIHVFLHHPFVGVGPNQFIFYGNHSKGHYSHNSFLEAATNLGFIGLALVCILFLGPLLQSFKSLNRQFAFLKYLNILFFISLILYNLLYVFYWNYSMMLFFFCVIELQNKLGQTEQFALST